MGFIGKFLFYGVFLSIILAALVYHPLHEDLNDRGLVRIAFGGLKISKYIVSIKHKSDSDLQCNIQN